MAKVAICRADEVTASTDFDKKRRTPSCSSAKERYVIEIASFFSSLFWMDSFAGCFSRRWRKGTAGLADSAMGMCADAACEAAAVGNALELCGGGRDKSRPYEGMYLWGAHVCTGAFNARTWCAKRPGANVRWLVCCDCLMACLHLTADSKNGAVFRATSLELESRRSCDRGFYENVSPV